MSSDCKKRLTCAMCHKNHPTCLHEERYAKKPEEKKRSEEQESTNVRKTTSCTSQGAPSVSTSMIVPVWLSSLGTFRSDYDYECEYEFFNVYPVRMPDCVRLSRQLVLSSKSRRRLDANYEIFNKSRPPTTSSLQVQRRAKRLVFKGADTL